MDPNSFTHVNNELHPQEDNLRSLNARKITLMRTAYQISGETEMFMRLELGPQI